MLKQKPLSVGWKPAFGVFTEGVYLKFGHQLIHIENTALF